MPLICKPFVFVRHGETPLNRDKVIGGSTDVPLTDEGEQQARSAAPILGRYDWNGVAVSSLSGPNAPSNWRYLVRPMWLCRIYVSATGASWKTVRWQS